jgi:uncharacterized protein (TIGR04255 family)
VIEVRAPETGIISEATQQMESDGLHLRVNGIKEAVCEVRFSAIQAPEVVLGRLADAHPWRNLPQVRLPAADIPAALRSMDPSLRYQASYEIPNPDGDGFVRIGPNVLSIHQVAPYEGWGVFKPRIVEAVQAICEHLPEATVERVGLRYINLLNEQDHMITSPHNLKLSITTGNDERVREQFVVNYRRELDETHLCQVGIATPDYAAGPVSEPFSVVVDVDVFTPDFVRMSNFDDTIEWIEVAHDIVKKQFFALWPQDILEKLKRD